VRVPGGGVLLVVESVGHQAHNIRSPARYSRARLTIGLVVQVSAPQAPHDETTDARQHTCPDSGMGWGLTQLVEVRGILSLVSPPVNRQFVTFFCNFYRSTVSPLMIPLIYCHINSFNEHPAWRSHGQEAKRGQTGGQRIPWNGEVIGSLLLPCALPGAP
jgi:hypothetical protein